VLTCLPQALRREAQCIATYGPRDAATTLRLDPVKTKKLPDGPDRRESARVRVAAEGAPEAIAVSIAPGAWDLVWPGVTDRRFSVEAGQAVHIELETTTGHCARVAGQCVQSDSTSRTAAVTVR
jgi:hypothetical protein